MNSNDLLDANQDIEKYRIFKKEYTIGYLLDNFKPEWKNKNKLLLQSLHENVNYDTNELVSCSRWSHINYNSITFDFNEKFQLDIQANGYEYEDYDRLNEMHWYKNFADARLFVAYASSLFAQDEIQVAEHPILANLLIAMYNEEKHSPGCRPFTVENQLPRPILIQNAVRKIAVDTINYPIYGNAFAKAHPDLIKQATKVLNPPVNSNIVCLVAPPGGYGAYRLEEIKYIFLTAYTGYKAIKYETREKLGNDGICVLHTGNWGAGAFGGSHELMALLQILAARCACIDRVVYHTFIDKYKKHVEDAVDKIEKIIQEESDINWANIDNLLIKIHAFGFKWGVSDGN